VTNDSTFSAYSIFSVFALLYQLMLLLPTLYISSNVYKAVRPRNQNNF